MKLRTKDAHTEIIKSEFFSCRVGACQSKHRQSEVRTNQGRQKAVFPLTERAREKNWSLILPRHQEKDQLMSTHEAHLQSVQSMNSKLNASKGQGQRNERLSQIRGEYARDTHVEGRPTAWTWTGLCTQTGLHMRHTFTGRGTGKKLSVVGGRTDWLSAEVTKDKTD